MSGEGSRLANGRRGRHRARRRARGTHVVLGAAAVLAGAMVSPSIQDRGVGGGDRVEGAIPPTGEFSPPSLAPPAQQRVTGRRLRRLSFDEVAVRVPQEGPATFRVARASADVATVVADVLYSVEVEDGLPFVLSDTGAAIAATLDDPRGWSGVLGTSMRRVDSDPEVRVLIATPGTTDELCAPLATQGRVSCRNGSLVVLNARRWASAVAHYRSRVSAYRKYLVNHEFGHALGQSHVGCPNAGEPAPVMQQQTYGLDGCRANAWPTVA